MPTSTKARTIWARSYLLYTLLKMCSQAVIRKCSGWQSREEKEHIYQLKSIFQLAKEHWRCSSFSRKTWLRSCQQQWHSSSCTPTDDVLGEYWEMWRGRRTRATQFRTESWRQREYTRYLDIGTTFLNIARLLAWEEESGRQRVN